MSTRAHLLEFVTGRSSDPLIARWLFLRALGLIYLSAFFPLLFQIRGLIGPDGILPASEYLARVAHGLGALRFWYAPTLLWFSAGSHMLMAISIAGVVASVLRVVNLWPRRVLAVCFVCFLSFVSAAEDFSGYQSDGMLLEAGFLSLLLAPAGVRPGWGRATPPLRASVLLLLWEWFRIYFESGVVKLASGDPTWRNFTAMDEYYQNGPLPTWIGWYMQHLPHWFHAATAGATLLMELVLVWMAFLPGRWRLACFWIVTVWQAGVILTANYTFLNYLVLVLGILLLEDRWLLRFVPRRWRNGLADAPAEQVRLADSASDRKQIEQQQRPRPAFAQHVSALGRAVALVGLALFFYVTLVPMVRLFWSAAPLPTAPLVALDPFRIANQYGLFAVMTPHRYEIEFQGSDDGKTWRAYPYRYKPQDPHSRPGIYAPYQPRLDWNLWFA